MYLSVFVVEYYSQNTLYFKKEICKISKEIQGGKVRIRVILSWRIDKKIVWELLGRG
jgi:hypothetical protein